MAVKKVLTSVPDSFDTALESQDDKAALRVIARLADHALLTEAALAAANAGRHAVVFAAIGAGADPNGVDEEGDSLLSIVAAGGDEPAMRALVLAGAVVDEAVLRAALGSNSKRAVACCVELLGASHAAVAAVEADVRNQVGLEWALSLLQGQPAPVANTYTLNDLEELDAAIAAKDRRRVDELIDKVGQDAVGRFGLTPLSYAIFSDEDLALEWLTWMQIDLEHRDHEGSTYLMAACSASRPRVVAELIARGVDIQAEDPGGHTALDAAVRTLAPGCFETAKVLLAAGARYGRKSQDRRSQGRIPAWVFRNARDAGRLPPEFADVAQILRRDEQTLKSAKPVFWDEVGRALGTLDGNGVESGGTSVAQAALCLLLDPMFLTDTAQWCVSRQAGSEAARSVLCLLRPPSVMSFCVERARSSSDADQRARWVKLLSEIADARAVEWAKEFAADPARDVRYYGGLVAVELQFREELSEEDYIALTERFDASGHPELREIADRLRAEHDFDASADGDSRGMNGGPR